MSERKRSDHAERPAGKGQGEKTGFHHSHAVRKCLAGTIAQSPGPDRVDLDRNYLNLAPRQSDSDCAETGAELNDELAGAKVRFGDDAVSDFGKKEILTEASSSLVARRPPRVEPKSEKPTPVPSKGVVRPAPSISPHEKPSPA